MVILSVHNSADIYGASRCLLRMLRLFVEDGHEAHVVIPGDGPLKPLLEADGIQVHLVPSLAIIDRSQLSTGMGRLAFPFRFLGSTAALVRLILRHHVDVVHTNTAVLPTGALAARLTGRKSLWHIREFFSEFRSLWRFFQYYMWLLSTRILVISDAVREQFEPRLRGKCTVVYDGLDTDAMEYDEAAARALRASAGDPAQLIAVVGRIKWVRKGQEILVKAAALLRERFPGARYLVVGTVAPGNEEHLHRLQALIHANDLHDRFVFAGEIADVRSVYAAADVTVVPSVQAEPFGCVVMESMALGTPVVGSRCGGIPEQIVDGQTGLLFEPGNEQELAEALAQLLGNEQLRQQMGRASQDHFRAVFGMQESYARMRACFDETAKSSTRLATAP